jgi:nitrate reductase NapAB chaperone NapD
MKSTMALNIKTISNYGVSHPVVARLVVQTTELIKFSKLTKAKQDAVCSLCMNSLQQRLLNCHDIFTRLQQATVESALKAENDQKNAQGNIIVVPVVVGLDGEAEAFLYQTKNYIRDLLNVFRIFFGYENINAAALYDATGKSDSAVVRWASKEFGEDDELTRLLRTEQAWIEQCIRMRNAVEHPDGYSGRLIIQNIMPRTGGGFHYPTWNLEGKPESDIYTDMTTTMDNLLTVAEDLLVICIKKMILFPTIAFYEIAERDRDPDIPQRLNVGLQPEIIAKIAKTSSDKH